MNKLIRVENFYLPRLFKGRALSKSISSVAKQQQQRDDPSEKNPTNKL